MDWTTWLQFTGTGVGAIMAFAALFAGIGYYKQGKKKGTIDGQTEEINAVTLLGGDVNRLRDEVKNLTDKVDRLTKENQEKDKKLNEWMLIFQGRDPATQSFMKSMEDYVILSSPLLKTIETEAIPTIRNMQRYLNKQTF